MKSLRFARLEVLTTLCLASAGTMTPVLDEAFYAVNNHFSTFKPEELICILVRLFIYFFLRV